MQPNSQLEPGQAPPAPHPQTYDFIINPEKPVTKRPLLPGTNPLLTRVAVVALGFIVLIVVFNVIMGLIKGSSNLPSMVTVAQDQQELIHVTTAGAQQQSLSLHNQNFAATAQLSLTSAQSKLLAYLTANKNKVAPKVLSLKVSSTVDSQLTAAKAAATYDQTFHDIMKAKLDDYLGALKQSYQLTKGKKGQALLSNDYDQALLLLMQLDATN